MSGSYNEIAVLGEYDVKVDNHGHATMSVVDFEGAEFLYAHGEATMGNGSGVVRLGGTELVSASTKATFYGVDNSNTRLDGDMSILDGSHNITIILDYSEKLSLIHISEPTRRS